MKKLLRTIGLVYISLFIFVSPGVAATANAHANNSEWTLKNYHYFVPSVGDQFLVDIENGLGYLVNTNTKQYSIFPVMTGAKYTPTPVKEWLVKEKNIQPNRLIFGETGEFLRMYMDGDKRTGYGIHGYAYFEKEIASGRKFLTRGCVMVSDKVHDVIEASYLANGKSLKMTTMKSIDISTYFVALSNLGVDYPKMTL